MENKDLISIVVPIYNVEKYLNKCIDSIIKQEYKNLEIILVDDGSPDECGNICDMYIKKDSRIKVIHKENGGLSEARNYGIDIAKGKYLTFVDSDDYISEDYIEYLYKLIKSDNYDISTCSQQYIYENKKMSNKKIIEEIHSFNKIEALENMLYQRIVSNSAWGKLYKASLFKNVRYPVGKIYEDLATTYKLFEKSNKIICSNIQNYFYLQRNTSIIGQKFRPKELEIISHSNDMYKEMSVKYPELIPALKSRILNANFFILRKLPILYKKEIYNQLKENIKKYRFEVLMDKKVRFKTKVGIINSYISFRLVSFIYNSLKNFDYLRKIQ